MSMQFYKRISRGKKAYSLFPVDANVDDIIDQYGANEDYYESIFLYSQEQFDNYTNGVKLACEYLKYKYDEKNILITATVVRGKLDKLFKDRKDKKAGELYSGASVAGTTDVRTRRIVFDFDKEDDILAAREDAKTTFSRLVMAGVPADQIQIYFSGKKGFTIEFLATTWFSPSEFVNIIYSLAGDLPTFDTTVKDCQRLMRIPLSKHKDSGLYKIPLTRDDLYDAPIDVIKQHAKDVSLGYYDILDKWGEIETPPQILELKNKAIDLKTKPNITSIMFDEELDLTKKPKWMPAEKYALAQGFFIEGERDHAFMILCATYKNQGFTKEQTYGLLKVIAEMQAEREKRRTGEIVEPYSETQLYTEVLNYVYGPSWRGGSYSNEQDELLKKVCERLNIKVETKETRFMKVDKAYQMFVDFATNIDANTIKLGIPEIDDKIRITTGMLVSILGAPSSGKTSLILSILESVSTNDEKALFYSFDMALPLILTRLIQRHTGFSQNKIFNAYKSGEVECLSEGIERINERLKNVDICFKSGSGVDDIEHDIIEFQKAYGFPPKVVAIDYLERIHGPYSEATANTQHIAKRLAEIANNYQICVLLLVQPQKSAGDASDPLTSYRQIKGSSQIEQDSRIVLTMWRPGFNPKDNVDDRYASLAVVKNNMGWIGSLDFQWDGAKGLLLPINDIEDFEKVQERSLRRKMQKYGDF